MPEPERGLNSSHETLGGNLGGQTVAQANGWSSEMILAVVLFIIGLVLLYIGYSLIKDLHNSIGQGIDPNE